MNGEAFARLRDQADRLRQQYHIDPQAVYELCLELATPLIIAEVKADIPVPGLPNLDGILQFAAFYWCVRETTRAHPELAQEYLWQVNEALRNPGCWIDFPIPLREIPIRNTGTGTSNRLYDCSVGLPVDPVTGETVYPVGDDFLDNRGQRFRLVVDNIPLRRRSVAPEHSHKPVGLTAQWDPKRGAHKALDNRIYFLVTQQYRFYFRGDPTWVDRLLRTMKDDGVGVGKKSSLGYGQIRELSISPVSSVPTLGRPLTNAQQAALGVPLGTVSIALLKSIPVDELFRWCNAGNEAENEALLGYCRPRILSFLPVLGGYTPPFWLKKNQTLVARYGSLLYGE